jgi:hypothetical protein
MIRTLFGLPAIVADYTVGTVIVLVQLAIQGHAGRNVGIERR